MSKEKYNKEKYNIELWEASTEGNLEGCIKAIENGADVNAKNRRGETFLFLASRNRNPVAAELLLQLGADVNLIESRGHHNTPLHEAVINGNKVTAELLLKHRANVNAVNRHGDTPLHTTINMSLDQAMVELLLKHGANVNAVNEVGWTPLYKATYSAEIFAFFGKKDIQILKLLINHGADVNTTTDTYTTPLWKAISNKDIVKFLIENGACANKDHEKTVTKMKNEELLPFLLGAQWCQDILHGEEKEIPENLGDDPITLLAKIMKGQLVERWSISKIQDLQQSDNSTVRSIIETHNFVEDTTNAIVEKHAVRLYNNISFGKVYNNLGLDTLSPAQQNIVVNKVKSLCGGITIDNEKISKALESNNLPDHMREEFHNFFYPNEELILPIMEEVSEAEDEELLKTEPAAGTSAEMSNNDGWEILPESIDSSDEWELVGQRLVEVESY